MQKIMCEMCGSNDLIKQDGVFVCQHCGTKYSLEEAKKLLGKIDVSGSTIKIDSSSDLKNAYILARRARDENNISDAIKYYNLILDKNATDWEATFYSNYFNAYKEKNLQTAINLMANCQSNVLSLIKENLPESNQYSVINEIISRNESVALHLLDKYGSAYKALDSNDSAKSKLGETLSKIFSIMYVCGDEVINIFQGNTNVVELAVDAWEKGITLFNSNEYLDDADTTFSYIKRVKKYDTAFSDIAFDNLKTKMLSASNSKVGCFYRFGIFFAIIFALLLVISITTDSSFFINFNLIALIVCAILILLGRSGTNKVKDEIKQKEAEYLES